MRTSIARLSALMALQLLLASAARADGIAFESIVSTLDLSVGSCYSQMFDHTVEQFREGRETIGTIQLDMAGLDYLNAGLGLAGGADFHYGIYCNANISASSESENDRFNFATEDSYDRFYFSLGGALCLGYKSLDLFFGMVAHNLSLGNVYDVQAMDDYVNGNWQFVSKKSATPLSTEWRGANPIAALYLNGKAIDLSSIVTFGEDYLNIGSLKTLGLLRLPRPTKEDSFGLSLSAEAVLPGSKDGGVWNIGPGISWEREQTSFDDFTFSKASLNVVEHGSSLDLFSGGRKSSLGHLAVAAEAGASLFGFVNLYARGVASPVDGLGFAAGLSIGNEKRDKDDHSTMFGVVGFEVVQNDFVSRLAECYSTQGRPLRCVVYIHLTM